jgi:hypothetical protein
MPALTRRRSVEPRQQKITFGKFAPEQMRQHLELVISFYCRFVTLIPRHRTGTYRMHALKPKVLLLIICALAVATVMHASVYLSIDVASLSAEMPPR